MVCSFTFFSAPQKDDGGKVQCGLPPMRGAFDFSDGLRSIPIARIIPLVNNNKIICSKFICSFDSPDGLNGFRTYFLASALSIDLYAAVLSF